MKTTEDPRTRLRKALDSGEVVDLRLAAERHPNHAPSRYHNALAAFREGDISFAATESAAARELRPSAISYEALVALCAFCQTGSVHDLQRLKQTVIPSTDPVRALSLMTLEKNIGRITDSFRGADEIEYRLGGPLGFLLDQFDHLAGWIYFFINHLFNLLRNLTKPTVRIANRLVIAGIRIEGDPLKRSTARTLFEKALVIDTENIYACESLARLSLLDRNSVAARRYLALYFKQVPEAFDQLPGIGWLADTAFISNEHDEAIPFYQRWIAKEPFAYMPCYRLGLCFLARKDEAAAFDAFLKTFERITPPALLTLRIDRLMTLLSHQQERSVSSPPL